jgi:hypothetical protein
MWRVVSFACLSILCGGLSRADDDSLVIVELNRLPQRARVDLGEASVGQPVEGAVELRNGLGKPLTIRSVDPDCGCLDVRRSGDSLDADSKLTLHLTLAPSQQVGVIRRTIRILFEESRSGPLDLGVDTTITGPVELELPSVLVRSPGETLKVSGRKRLQGLEILSCESVRGSSQVVGLEQGESGFDVSVKPLFSFGSAHELVRVRYRTTADAAPQTVDLPLELRGSTPIRFLPSTVPLTISDGHWHATSRLVLTPGSGIKVSELEIAVMQENGEEMKRESYSLEFSPISSVLSRVEVIGRSSEQSGELPAKLNVTQPNSQPLATLDIINLQGDGQCPQ